MLKIFHIADVHIGKKFATYPPAIRSQLIQARFTSLENAVLQADANGCDLLIIAGDLFESLRVSEKDRERVNQILGRFQGEYVLILPGNHDYYEEAMDFWPGFSRSMSDHTLLLTRAEQVRLNVGEKEVVIYPAPCDSKHSETHRLDWMKGTASEPGKYTIAIAHGAIPEISPDMNRQYFTMPMRELEALPVQLVLTGHTHIPWPASETVSRQKVFNPGTTEPDGMDYSCQGAGWMITLEKEGNTYGERVSLGSYRFLDTTLQLGENTSLATLEKVMAGYQPDRLLLRLRLTGELERETFEMRGQWYRILEEKLGYLQVVDSDLKIRWSPEMVDQEFPGGSLPHTFLHRLLKETDGETAQLAYQIIQEVRRS